MSWAYVTHLDTRLPPEALGHAVSIRALSSAESTQTPGASQTMALIQSSEASRLIHLGAASRGLVQQGGSTGDTTGPNLACTTALACEVTTCRHACDVSQV